VSAIVIVACATTTTERTDVPRVPQPAEDGGDRSTLPERFPDGDWIPLLGPIGSFTVQVEVVVNGERAMATLDTGAQATSIPWPVAKRAGVIVDEEPSVRVIDAHGNEIRTPRGTANKIRFGGQTFREVRVLVVGEDERTFLIGMDVLRKYELDLAPMEGLVGLFRRPIPPHDDDRVVRAQVGEEGDQLFVQSAARGASGPVEMELLVDTGATLTSVPVFVGVAGGLPAAVHGENKMLALSGEETSRGRFVLDPLVLDGIDVGRVAAVPHHSDGGLGHGLLGNDVLLRDQTIIRPRAGEIAFRTTPVPPATRARGPEGQRCEFDACISVAMKPPDDDDLLAFGQPCLEVYVAPAYHGRTVELLITTADADDDPLAGGRLRVTTSVGAEGVQQCYRLWPDLYRRGLSADTALSLRFVRTEGVVWTCDPMETACVTFSGVLDPAR
jgi:predicted aspartyl protease